MTYDKQWKTAIDKEWDTYKKKWEQENPDTKIPQTRFSFMNIFIKKKYEEESEGVKEEVRARREKMKTEEKGDLGTGERNEEIQR